MTKKALAYGFTLIVLFSLLAGCAAPTAQTPTSAATDPVVDAPVLASEGDSLILATTTSTQDSGLLDYLLPLYTEETGVKVEVIAVGTGQALKLGEDGNADVLLVHARAKEDDFMTAGHGIRREDVMYNDFVIAGPASDPAGIGALATAAEAFRKIAEAQATFISRGDESGTHTKEKGIWTKAEIEPIGDWYVSAGQGMGEVLTMASEQQAYSLSDRATFLARKNEGLDLEILMEGEKALLNPYGVIAVNPNKGAHIKADLANQFIDWIISLPVQEKIAAFGQEEYGQSLFIPDSTAWKNK